MHQVYLQPTTIELNFILKKKRGIGAKKQQQTIHHIIYNNNVQPFEKEGQQPRG